MENQEGPRPRTKGSLLRVILPLLAVAAILSGLWYWQSRSSSDTKSNSGFGVVTLPGEKNSTSREPGIERDRAAPDFVLETLDGKTVRLSDLQGRPVVLNFWATWCAPCRIEMPEFVRAYREHEDAGLVVLAVNLKESANEIQPFVSEFGVSFPVLLDRDGQVSTGYRVKGLPETYFIDRSGVIRDSVIGPIDQSSLPKKLESILGNGG